VTIKNTTMAIDEIASKIVSLLNETVYSTAVVGQDRISLIVEEDKAESISEEIKNIDDPEIRSVIDLVYVQGTWEIIESSNHVYPSSLSFFLFFFLFLFLFGFYFWFSNFFFLFNDFNNFFHFFIFFHFF